MLTNRFMSNRDASNSFLAQKMTSKVMALLPCTAVISFVSDSVYLFQLAFPRTEPIATIPLIF
jgi:hypothetical protein